MDVISEPPITIMKNRYPQLLLPIKQDMSKSWLYRNTVRFGQPVPQESREFCFTGSKNDTLTEAAFSCGNVTVLYLEEREDFEMFVQKTAFRCEPKSIPKSMGAITISGLFNWETDDYERKPSDRLYSTDSLIVLSKGFYSSLDYTYTLYSSTQWLDKSYQIRKFHELTHFICRKKYNHLKNILMDEIFADCMGLIMATGRYDEDLAKHFLGVTKNKYTKGMRLENYIKAEELSESIEKIWCFMDVLKIITDSLIEVSEDFENRIDFCYSMAAQEFEQIFRKEE